MRPPEEIKSELVRQWLRKADADLHAAESLRSGEQPSFYPSAFHSQQAAEKYIKGFLTWHQVEFPKTHAFGALLDLAASADKELAAKLSRLTVLDAYAVDVRYPGDIPEPTRESAEEALNLARLARQAVLKVLPSL